MGIQIESAGVNSNGAIVDTTGRLLTSSAVQDQLTISSQEGNGFWINTGFVSLTTTGSFSAILYVKNTSATKDLNISSITFSSDVACQQQAYRNPTGGTITSAGTTLSPANVNFASGSSFGGTALAGVDGSTITGGTVASSVVRPIGVQGVDLAGAVILSTNNSIAFTMKPAAAGTVAISVFVYFTNI